MGIKFSFQWTPNTYSLNEHSNF